MHLLIISTAGVGNSDDSYELEVEKIAIDAQKPAIASEKIRAKYNLSASHRGQVEEWIKNATVGDTLLVNVKEYRSRGEKSALATDDVAIVMCPGIPPAVSRLVFKEVTTVEAALQTLPPNAKRITRASKKMVTVNRM